MNGLPGFLPEVLNKPFIVLSFLLLLTTGSGWADTIVQNELDWDGKSIVEISDEWEFCWHAMLTSAEERPRDAEIYTIPFLGSWQSNTEGDNRLPSYGYGTYQKIIILPPDRGKHIILRIPQVDPAIAVYCNGELIYSNGTVGGTAETSVPEEYRPVLREISSETGIFDISIQMSNFDLDSYGNYLMPVMSSVDTAFGIQAAAFMANALLITALLILAIYLLASGIKLNNRWSIYLGLSYITNVLFLLVNGEVFLGQLGLSRLIIWKIHYLSRFLTFFFFFCFTMEFFSVRLPRLLNLSVRVFTVLLSSVFLLTKPPLLPHFLIPSALIGYGIIVFGIVLSIKGVLKDYPRSRVYLTAILILAVFMSFDILNNPPSWPILFNCKSSIGLLLFGIIHTLMLIDILSTHVSTIEKLVDKRTRELEAAVWAQARYARVGEMLNFIAHQWQQYLYAVSANVEGLNQEEEKSISGKKRLEIYGTISEAVRSMFSTLKDFRNFLSPVRNRERFNVHDEGRKVFSLLEDLFLTKGIEINIETSGDTRIWGVKNELQQVILNLLTNAVNIIEKRSIDSPYIHFISSGSSDSVSLVIEDNAGGISSRLREELFKQEKNRETIGSGMGLYMSRRIIRERFDGDMIYEDGLSGARFVIILPKDYRKSVR